MVTDYKMPGKNGVELIRRDYEEIAPAARIVLISRFVDAMGMTEERPVARMW
jgi:YesN/AraC family two-component response regulator